MAQNTAGNNPYPTGQDPRTFINLPAELRLDIYGHCSAFTLLQLTHACRRFHNEINYSEYSTKLLKRSHGYRIPRRLASLKIPTPPLCLDLIKWVQGEKERELFWRLSRERYQDPEEKPAGYYAACFRCFRLFVCKEVYSLPEDQSREYTNVYYGREEACPACFIRTVKGGFPRFYTFCAYDGIRILVLRTLRITTGNGEMLLYWPERLCIAVKSNTLGFQARAEGSVTDSDDSVVRSPFVDSDLESEGLELEAEDSDLELADV
ncbi:hypothetical protein BJ508DRAFT_320961 [Ascobolus immersus RN42]|uniref:F-box domain-containing protein n=1 Tax=Ascobolus immersus RN42 TaxID=1160509 RepID=A0A3N4INQ3_ASCIM|nr:hypothetical protein BJ508DRAFT_320961 [Ascobolus immersus RN42]